MKTKQIIDRINSRIEESINEKIESKVKEINNGIVTDIRESYKNIGYIEGLKKAKEIIEQLKLKPKTQIREVYLNDRPLSQEQLEKTPFETLIKIPGARYKVNREIKEAYLNGSFMEYAPGPTIAYIYID